MTQISDSLKQAVHEQVEALCLIASEHLNQTIVPPSIGFRRSGGNAGTAHLQRNHVNLNPIYLSSNQDEFIAQVIPHEIAHIIVYQYFGKTKPHGREWQAVMLNVFGRPPHVRHSMTAPEARKKIFNYRCDCGPTELTIRRHNKVVRGEQQYQCRRCNTILRYVD